MANPHRGEVGFDADGKEWLLRYSTNALCTLEDDLDISTGELVEKMQQPSGVRMSTLRAVFWAGLQDHHPEVTKEQAGDLMTEIGFANVGPLIGEAFTRTFPQEDESTARPRKGGKAGTGNGSLRSSSL